MIIETRDDVVRLSGSLHKNQWLTIKAAAAMALQQHPEGIIVDCSRLEDISEDGAKTFLEAMRDIEAARSRIIVASLPQQIMNVLKTVPGVRSQLPIAESVESARESLRRMTQRTPTPTTGPEAGKRKSLILVPLLADLDLSYGADLAGRVARPGRHEIQLVYFLEVARTLPLNAPLVEEERAAQEALSRALQLARPYNLPVSEHIEHVREAGDGILAAIRSYPADIVVLGATSEPLIGDDYDQFQRLIDMLLSRAPCEVLIGRLRRQPLTS
ncbi:MAG TPA: STAS domain-containing protein [Chthonomonadaceae bacterium]|nr:STAS domain-containing protein [Chthonomonadaceae bacterium]